MDKTGKKLNGIEWNSMDLTELWRHIKNLYHTQSCLLICLLMPLCGQIKCSKCHAGETATGCVNRWLWVWCSVKTIFDLLPQFGEILILRWCQNLPVSCSVYSYCLTLRWLLSVGNKANSCMANITVTKACHAEGSLDARQTDAKIDALNDAVLETLK